jgi:WD40 repeat protein
VLSRATDVIAIGGDRVSAITTSRDGQTVAAGTRDGTVVLLGAATLGQQSQLHIDGHGPVNGLAFTPDGRRLVSWGGGVLPTQPSAAASIVVWDVAGRQPVGAAFGEAWPGPGGGLAADGATLILAQHAPDRTVAPVAWNIDARTPSTAYPLPGGEVESVWLSANGRSVVLGGAGGSTVVDLATGEMRALAGAVRPLALSPDGATLLTADGADVIIWDVPTADRRGTASGSMGDVLIAGWAPDGRAFASAASDGRITIWDAQTLRPSRVLAGNGIAAHAVAFAADGRTIFSAALDGPVLAWDLTGTSGVGADLPPASDVQRLASMACSVAGRDLSREEWARFLPGRPYQHVCPD